MEGKKFPWLSDEYHLEKRPRYSKTSFSDDQMPSTSSACTSSTHRYTPAQRISIKRSDEKLLLWQERQIVECIKENMVNQMVESYMLIGRDDLVGHSSVGGSQHDEERVREGHLATYHAERVRQSFENSAIARAIGQYGLHKHTYQLFDDNQMETMSTSSSSISLSSPPDSPISRGDWCPFTHSITTNANVINDTNKAVHTETAATANQSNALVVNDSVSDLVAHEKHCDSNPSNDEHFDFLEAAVSVAIQEKGLLQYTMQKSPNR